MSDVPLIEKVRAYCDQEDTDLLVYLGNIRRDYDDQLINVCRHRTRKRKNLVLLLTTHGGDPNAAYRMGRCLQMVYSPPSSPTTIKQKSKDDGKFSVLVNSVCKSAGTLLALSADEIIMTGNAELGPLDIQLRKPDEVGERTSGLTPMQAITYLQSHSRLLFKEHFKMLRFDTDLNFPTKLSAKVATNVTKGLLAPIYEQIDPMRLAEVNRSLSITEEYAERLQRNLKGDALHRLIMDYPSHGFVIDREEARDLFQNVSKPSPLLFEIAESFKALADSMLERDEVFTMFLNDFQGPAGSASDEQEDDDGSAHASDGARESETEPNAGPGPSPAPDQRDEEPAERQPPEAGSG